MAKIIKVSDDFYKFIANVRAWLMLTKEDRVTFEDALKHWANLTVLEQDNLRKNITESRQ